MTEITPTKRSKVQRLAKRGVYDKDTICEFIDEALICHVGFLVDGEPRVLPTAICRIDDNIYLHGNRNSMMLKALVLGSPVCVTVTHMDGLVLARSGFNHSMNYRSVVIHGHGTEVTGAEKLTVLDAFVEALIPGRNQDLRPATQKEINATTIVQIPLTEAAAKVRTGPPIDSEGDYELDCWAGVVPIKLVTEEPVADEKLKSGVLLPNYLKAEERQ